MKRRLADRLDRHACAWVTPPELAAYVECDRRMIVRMVDEGAIPSYRVARGRRRRINLADALAAFPPDDAAQRVRRRPGRV